MKRPWLTAFLTVLILCAAAIGIYREANHTLARVLTRLQESLPAHSHFTYRTAYPSLFIGGATLEDVTLRTPTASFHAAQIRLGHPRFLHDGSISLASLLLDHPDYQSSGLNFHLAKAIFRHLLIPASADTTRTDLTTLGTRSLAAVMSFDPHHLSSLRFGRAHVEGLDFSFPTQQPFLFPDLHLSRMTVEQFTLEGYGTGSRVFGDAHHFSFALSYSTDNLPSWPSPFAELLLPKDASTHTTMPITVTLDSITARNGHTHWLQHAPHEETSLAQKFYRDPLQNIWESPGSLRFHALKVGLGSPETGSAALLEDLTMIRRNEATTLRTETELRGLHLKPAEKQRFSIPINGHQTVFHLTENSQNNYGLWENDLAAHMTLPSIGALTFNAHSHLPTETPLQLHPSSNGAPFTQQAVMDNAVITLKGERFLDLWAHLIHIKATPEERHHDHDGMLQAFGLLITTRPLLTPMMDYVLSPKDRTLAVNIGTLSLDDLMHLPFRGPIDALLDRAHVTAVTVH